MSRLKDRALGLFPVRVVRRYSDAKGSTWAIVVAWNGLFAFFPIVLVVVTVLGLVLRDPGTRQSFIQRVATAFPDADNQRQIVTALDSFREHAGILAVVGFLSLMWSGSSLIGAFENALDALYPCRPRSFVRQKLMAFGMILLFTILVVPLLLSSSLLSIVDRVPGIPSVLTSGPVATVVQLAVGIIDGALLFGAIYYVVPNRRQRVRQVLPGALAAGVLLELFTLLFPLYFRISGGFNRFGATFALFFLLLTYFYFLGQITVLSAAVNAELDPSPGACDDPGDADLGGGLASADRVREETDLRGRRDAPAQPTEPPAPR